MPRHPAQLRRTDADLEDGHLAVGETPQGLDDLDLVPRRREAIEGTRGRVVAEQGRGAGVDVGDPLEDRHVIVSAVGVAALALPRLPAGGALGVRRDPVRPRGCLWGSRPTPRGHSRLTLS
jgi:hypothetical protein